MWAWLEEVGSEPGRHAVVSDTQLGALASLFYGGRVAPDFERRGLADITATFKANGLVQEFWRLPE